MLIGSNSENRNFDSLFAIVILSLNILGLINLYSASHGISSTSANHFFWQQIIWLSIGWALFFIITFLNYQIIKRWVTFIYISNLGALISVIFIGKKSLGAQRWIDLGLFKFQPSETMKVALVLLVARLLTFRIRKEGMGIKDLIAPIIFTLIPFAITVIQPDLGTSLLYVAVVGTMLVFTKIRLNVLISGLLLAALAMPLAWTYGLKDYQKSRVKTFLSPDRDPRGAGYNSIQSRIAVGSGQFFGKGFRKGTQSQLEFLPERHTDFIFSVLSEEHGFLGGITTLLLFGTLFILGLKIAQNTKDPYANIVTVGLLSIIFWHFFINVAMVMGLLPIVGVPLPLLSYGGSSLLTTMGALGVISSTSYNRSLF